MNTFRLNIIYPEGSVKETDCSSLVVPTPDGSYGIMANHSPVIISVTQGKIKHSLGENTEYTETAGAVLRFENNEATLLLK